jgi:SAM-dependent methyltransferase
MPSRPWRFFQSRRGAISVSPIAARKEPTIHLAIALVAPTRIAKEALAAPDGSATACAVCHAPVGQDAAVRLGKSHLTVCSRCGSWTYFPRPTPEEQARIHDDSEYFDHPYFELRRRVTPTQRRRCRDIFWRLSIACGFTALRGQHLLDIGCDTGVFLRAAREEFGVVPIGIDVSARAVAAAQQEGIEAYQTLLEEAPPHLTGLPLATAIDVIEHVPDPGAFLREVRSRLAPGGVVYVETPNIRSAVYGLGRALSRIMPGSGSAVIQRLFPPQHVQYFTPPSLNWLAREADLEVVRIDTRVLPLPDIAASVATRLAVGVLQVLDRVLRREILVWAILRRPRESGGEVLA